ncbi:MAG: MATE family efflux transporter [Candidatus Cloacimonadota bacterium]|nr:MAG: MATE family efflux transporter [Candidatus Cloacimonadota bacterium]
MQKTDLTKGAITPALLKLALPIMLTSFAQMAYNMTDMIWIGRIGSKAVAGAGTAGFYVWMGFAFILISKIGAEIGVSQSIGRKDKHSAVIFARNAVFLNIFSAIFYGLLIFFSRKYLIEFFDINDAEVIKMAETYLGIIAFGIPFMFLNPVLSGIYNGTGDSKTPFYINSSGLLLNIILDPLLIFGWGFFPRLEIAGAAIATILSQSVVSVIFIFHLLSGRSNFKEFSLLQKPDFSKIFKIAKLGFPVALQSGLFTSFAILIAKIIAKWGPIPIAVQKVGAQIEALSWMTASGYSSALSAFTGQNYGAGKWDRIGKGFISGIASVSAVGIFATTVFLIFPRQIFSIFIPEAEAIRHGVVYLRILAISQLFMVWEITAAGAFNGIGKTIQPSVVSVLFNGLRVPGAMILSSAALLGLNGIWWSISLSSIFKGIILIIWFTFILINHPDPCVRKQIMEKVFIWDFKYLRDKRGINGKL